MNRITRFVMGAFLTAGVVFTGMPSVDAATFTELPLVNNASAKMDAQDAAALEDVNQVYYNKIIDTINMQNEYTIADGSEVEKVVEKYKSEDSVPSKEVLAQIANEANVDVVFAMQIDEFNDEKIPSRQEPAVLLKARGLAVAYNNVTGQYYKSLIYENIEMEEVFIPRGNWKIQEFAKIVGREVRHALKIKKVKINKPRMSKF